MSRAILLALASSALLALACVPKPVQVVVNYCDLPWANCPGCEVASCDGTLEQWWCCEPGEGCYPVEYALDCGSASWLAYCEHGRSTQASTPDGEGWECLE